MVDPSALDVSRRAAPAGPLRLAGVTIPPDPAILTPPIRDAIADGSFERREARLVAGALEPGDRVLEIGAGIGFVSTLLARDPRATRVVAVEANPRLMGYMARLHRANGVDRVRRINAVLTNGPDGGAAAFHLRRDFWMGSLLPGPEPALATLEVPTLNFAALLAEEAITLVVCDIEGGEADLFESAELGGLDRVLVELHDHLTGLAGVARTFAALAARGFAYDPRHADGPVVLFRRLRPDERLRPYRP